MRKVRFSPKPPPRINLKPAFLQLVLAFVVFFLASRTIDGIAFWPDYVRARLPDHAALVPAYLDEGNAPDQPGNFVAWLHTRAPVYAYRFAGGWYDIGDPDQLLEADNRMRERSGLPKRDTYSLD